MQYAVPMTDEPLVSVSELAVWVREDISEDDDYANLIVRAATVAVTSYADMDPAWTLETAPSRIKNIVAQIAKRNWINSSRLTREGSIGPIGGDAYVAEMAAGMDLTDYEMSEIARLSSGGSPPGSGNMSIVTFTTGRGAPYGGLRLQDSRGSGIAFLDYEKDPYYFPTVD